MKDQQKKDYPNFLVLMDFSEASYLALKYTISIAKKIGGQIHVANILNPNRTSRRDNVSSDIISIESEIKKIESKLNSIVEIIAAENIQAYCHCAIGNIFNKLKYLIEHIEPNLIVVGRKKEKIQFSGIMSDYLLNNYSGSLLIISKECEFSTDTSITVGCYNKMLSNSSTQIISELTNSTLTPITILCNKNKNEAIEEIKTIENQLSLPENNQKVVYKDLQIESIQKHASVQENLLLCISRKEQKGFLKSIFDKKALILNQLISEVRHPILLIGYTR